MQHQYPSDLGDSGKLFATQCGKWAPIHVLIAYLSMETPRYAWSKDNGIGRNVHCHRNWSSNLFGYSRARVVHILCHITTWCWPKSEQSGETETTPAGECWEIQISQSGTLVSQKSYNVLFEDCWGRYSSSWKSQKLVFGKETAACRLRRNFSLQTFLSVGANSYGKGDPTVPNEAVKLCPAPNWAISIPTILI